MSGLRDLSATNVFVKNGVVFPNWGELKKKIQDWSMLQKFDFRVDRKNTTRASPYGKW